MQSHYLKKILNILNKMDIGETSKPIKRQNSIIFLKISDKRSSKTKDINLSELKSKLVNQKRMNYIIFTHEAIYQNLKIIV